MWKMVSKVKRKGASQNRQAKTWENFDLQSSFWAFGSLVLCPKDPSHSLRFSEF